MPGRGSELRLKRDAAPASGCQAVLRLHTGPEADEIAILLRPDGARAPDAVLQAEAAYEALVEALASHDASVADVVGETLLLRDAARDLSRVLAVRERLLSSSGSASTAPAPSVVQQAPVEPGAAFEILVHASAPRDRDAWSVRDVRAPSACACEACRLSGARLVRLGEQLSLHTTSLHGVGEDALAEASDMFHAAERLLEQGGMGFRDVVRTWVHLRDIDRDYDTFNRARRAFFRSRGIDLAPASTGIQGAPCSNAHTFSLRLGAVKLPRPLDVRGMSTPLLNEAWRYGADFSRGLRVVETNGITLHVSGTASIDEGGSTVHLGELEAQAERMLDNVESLLSGEGATFESLLSGIAYVKRASDVQILRGVARRRGFDGFPLAIVEAGLCRPELLCEVEVVAMLPRSPEAR
ncbi:MAG: hypothetical protein FJ144_11700 [Deltaproteobacteria bacterium]|nr:hypothetical protein [Deltaproteobacteria bacterium]